MNYKLQKFVSLGLTAIGVAGEVKLQSILTDNLKYSYNEETRQEELVGNVNINYTDNLYVVEFESNLDKSSRLFLCRKFTVTDIDRYKDLKSNLIIDENNNYGTIKNATPIIDYIMYYNYDLKKKYTGEEISELFERIKSDYQNINDNKELHNRHL